MRRLIIAASLALVACGNHDHTQVTDVCSAASGHVVVRAVVSDSSGADQHVIVLVDGKKVADASVADHSLWGLLNDYLVWEKNK